MSRPPIHPGEILSDKLGSIGVTPTELARQINVPPNRVTQIIDAKRAITGDTALRLGHRFKTSAEFWINLQSAPTTSAWLNRKPVRRSRCCPSV